MKPARRLPHRLARARLGSALLASGLLAAGLLVGGCGGSDDGSDPSPQPGFVFSARSSYAGQSSPLEATGTLIPDTDGGSVRFDAGNRSLVLDLPSTELGTYSFGSGPGLVRGLYGESGVAGTNEWEAVTSGTVTLSESGDGGTRVRLSGARFVAVTGGAAGAFTLNGSNTAFTVQTQTSRR